MYTAVKATAADADVILKFYDLRREQVMRKARKFFGAFQPQSVDDVLKVMNDFGSEENAYFRQVIAYWEMGASLVLRGALHEELFLDNAGEMFFIVAKFAPYLDQLREAIGMPLLLAKCEELINRTSESRERLQRTIEMQKRLRSRLASAAGAEGKKAA